MDNVFFTILNDDAVRMQGSYKKSTSAVVEPPRLPAVFAAAVDKNHDVLIHSQGVGFGFETPVCYQNFISFSLRDVPHSELAKGLRNTSIAGIYDLKKPFDQARSGTDILPASAIATIRSARFEAAYPSLPWWRKALLLSPGMKTNFIASLPVTVNP